jgi:hypothetical protein
MNYCNKDERSIIYQKLHPADWEIWRVAHNSRYEPTINIEYIVRNGYLNIIIWMNYNSWNYEIFKYALKYEQLHILNWLKSNHYNFKSGTGEYAARKGLLSVLKWVKINIQNTDWNEVCKEAVFDGQLGVLQWILVSENRIPWSRQNVFGLRQDIVRIANNYEHFHIIEWLDSLPPTII